MADETARPAQANERQDVKKRGASSAPGGSALRVTVRALGELLGGMAESSAEAFRGFNEKLGARPTPGASATLATDLVDGLAEGNARFLEGMAQASRKAYEHLKASGEAPSAPESIDYERLARHVALEMQKVDKKG
jgi:hypothetical protein